MQNFLYLCSVFEGSTVSGVWCTACAEQKNKSIREMQMLWRSL